MDDNDHKKSVKDLVKAFDSTQKKDLQKVNTAAAPKEKVPLFPTLKKLPKDVNNKYTEETHNKNEDPNDYQKKKSATIYKPEPLHNIPIEEKKVEKEKHEDKKEEKEKKEEKKDKKGNKNPLSFLWKNKKNKVNDDSKVILDKKNNLEINKEIQEPIRRRNSSFDGQKQETENQELSGGDIPEVDEPVVPLTYKETEELLKDPKFVKVKELKSYTDTEFEKTVTDKKKGHLNIVKSLVSQDKTRFCYDGFDLDLTYITTKIIAMGFPSKAIEGIYRNSMEDVKNFFAKRHPNHYKVYNLCDDKKYGNCFYKQGWFPFKDHEAPPLNLIRPFCEDAKSFLDEDKENVVAIHCKAGKGRTGTFICCLLLYMKFFETAEECLLYYGLMRVGTVKGVTVPSQIRYVHYFESILKNNISHPIKFKNIIIRKVKMYTIPKIGKKKFVPNFTIENNGKTIKYSDINKKKETYTVTNYDLPFIEFPMSVAGHAVSGDVKFTFYHVQLLKSDKIFKFWFNTNFLPQGGVYEIKKEGIDKACKDKKCKIYKEDFKIEIEYIYS